MTDMAVKVLKLHQFAQLIHLTNACLEKNILSFA